MRRLCIFGRRLEILAGAKFIGISKRIQHHHLTPRKQCGDVLSGTNDHGRDSRLAGLLSCLPQKWIPLFTTLIGSEIVRGLK